uniref:Uncharacterized protein n=1 Tax=Arundo donax TaxID=35708 RepID=A0A0A8ZNP3_ARUDO
MSASLSRTSLWRAAALAMTARTSSRSSGGWIRSMSSWDMGR